MSYSNALEYLESKLKEERGLIVESLTQGKLDEGEFVCVEERASGKRFKIHRFKKQEPIPD